MPNDIACSSFENNYNRQRRNPVMEQSDIKQVNFNKWGCQKNFDYTINTIICP